jgi:hypothetical protein
MKTSITPHSCSSYTTTYTGGHRQPPWRRGGGGGLWIVMSEVRTAQRQGATAGCPSGGFYGGWWGSCSSGLEVATSQKLGTWCCSATAVVQRVVNLQSSSRVDSCGARGKLKICLKNLGEPCCWNLHVLLDFRQSATSAWLHDRCCSCSCFQFSRCLATVPGRSHPPAQSLSSWNTTIQSDQNTKQKYWDWVMLGRAEECNCTSVCLCYVPVVNSFVQGKCSLIG